MTCAHAEDGYDLWLRYRPLPQAAQRQLQSDITGIVATAQPSPLVQSAVAELSRGIAGLSGTAPTRSQTPRNGSLVVGTPASVPAIAALQLPLQQLGDEGYLLRSVRQQGRRITVIAANSDRGVLYGSFALLAHLQRGGRIDNLDVSSTPKIQLRMLDHWDNLDGHVERGYAGASLWDWWRLPEVVDPRYRDYARANASIGINAVVVNNVNAVAVILRPDYIAKARPIADALRPYGIRLFLSVRFSSPVELGGLTTADPMDPAVRAWWRAKADEIYAVIPDFGGFLVKANSEGQPGPSDYGRTHADGANALADALKPHGGVVLWRAFVYSEKDATDRAMQAYRQLKSLDGTFASNVVLQVKNGPIDFQPREPFHPLFGAMPKTSLGMEFQITKEYLGFATHLAYLGTLYEEVLRADTYANGQGSTVARVIDGSLGRTGVTAMAGVANTGRDRNWSGSQFDQANWYAFGRFAWDPGLSARDIAMDWVKMTFGSDPALVESIVAIMMGSREAVVNYMTPLGLAHLMGTGHHYGPAPWVSDQSRPEWNPVYYHRADARGIGFDRTASGSNALAQYAPQVAAQFQDPGRTPLESLLWFHHVSWDFRLSSGRNLWEELISRYDNGVQSVADMQATWAKLDGRVDAERHAEVAAMLGVQLQEARWWRDASLAYWQSISGRPLPAGVKPPAASLAYYKSLQFPYAPGR
ncbi:MAG: alpha-glucuronidase family glycosyl hydrolase [Pseudomonadota bacterium]